MIRVENLSYTVGQFALDAITLEVAAGEYFVLLGPTGSGKTLFVECLCGLLRPAAGRITIDGRDVTELAPRLRGIGYVPQHQALFPHLSVYNNIAFPLRARHLASGEIRKRVAALADLLRLGYLVDRWPAHLSGGERQKVALARALAARPRLLVLDEPVSALDEATREHLCAELRRIHRELRLTTLHISHSIEEALSVADRAGVLQEGRLVQAGPIAELLRRPASGFVAGFFRTENVLAAEAHPDGDDAATLHFRGHAIRVPHRRQGPVVLTIRPEALTIHPAGADVPNGIPAVLRRVVDRGPYRRLEFDAGLSIVAYSNLDAEELAPAIGQPHTVRFPPEAVHVLP